MYFLCLGEGTSGSADESWGMRLTSDVWDGRGTHF